MQQVTPFLKAQHSSYVSKALNYVSRFYNYVSLNQLLIQGVFLSTKRVREKCVYSGSKTFLRKLILTPVVLQQLFNFFHIGL